MIPRRPTAVDVTAVVFGVITIVLGFKGGSVDTTVVFMGVICLIPLVLKYLGIVELPAPIVVMVAIAPWLHGMGLAMGYYRSLENYDTLTHTFSSMVVAVIVFYALSCVHHYSGGTVNFAGRGLAILTALLSMTFSVYWEVLEYLSDVFFSAFSQYSPYDTITDLICDAAGAVIGSVWVGFYMRGRTTKDVIESFHLSDRIQRFVSKRAEERGGFDAKDFGGTFYCVRLSIAFACNLAEFIQWKLQTRLDCNTDMLRQGYRCDSSTS